MTPGLRVRASAPLRVADVGGWTDTWFSGTGAVCSVAVAPLATVEVRVVAHEHDGPPVRLVAPGLGLDARTGPSEAGWAVPLTCGHPLLEHALAEVLEQVPLPERVGLEVRFETAIPPGASMGTSASTVVALLAALDRVAGRAATGPGSLAARAHRVETVRAGRQAGVQDQWAAAAGGVSLLRVEPYPETTRTPVAVPAECLAALDERLVTVIVGGHDSSAVHQQVIAAITDRDRASHPAARHALDRLAGLALEAADALTDGDLPRWAGTLSAATDTQHDLHAGLLGAAHARAIAVARDQGALGWKINGAGGAAGSLTALAGEQPGAAAQLRADLARTDPAWTVLKTRIAGPAEVT